MEFEADLAGMETAYRTGYDPKGMLEVLEELKRIEASSSKQGSWFSTHPPLSERIQKCRNQLSSYPDRASLAQLPERYGRYVK
jgi:predicted Zn-dependent protease